VLCRLCDPSSELRIAEHSYEHGALEALLGIPAEKVNDDRLYRTLDALLPHKAAFEKYLKERLGTLFDLKYDLLLHDITSTYFEGEAGGNPQAQYGYSRDHRSDCKQVCIGMVVSRCGMPLGYEVFAGNRADVTTVEEIVKTMEARSGRADRIGAMDRGMVSQELWEAYIQLTEAEAAFRVHKSDLSVRPIWHQIEKRLQAHILVCFLAYVLWKTLAQRCKVAGLGDEPRKVLDELKEIQMVDLVLPTQKGTEIRKRCVSRPTKHQTILLQHLGLNLPSSIKMTEM